jgi:hypothetical protein
MPSRSALVLACLLAGGLALGVASALRSESGDERARAPGATSASALEAELARLRERLEVESANRVALAAEVAALREQVAALAPKRPVGSVAGGAAAPAGEPEAEAPAQEDAAAPPVDPERGTLAFDPTPLLAAGFRESEVERLRARIDEFEMERLYLRDQAAREGWHGTPRYREELRALGAAQAGLREEFGEELYDWMLYASGSPNRVAVGGLLEGSPAAAAGVRPGDVIVRYGERNIFDPFELRQATLRGASGASVALDLDRDGDRIRVYVPRGPLGARLEARSVPPSSR